MTEEYLFMIKKLLKAKSLDLHNHSVFTGSVFETIVATAAKQNHTVPITAKDANALGILHDIGKVYINDVIFNKQESLSSREWETIQLHPAWGKQFVSGTIFDEFGKYIVQHHEKCDGTGYPNRLKDHEIHGLSHILNMADQIASLLENRPYKRSIDDKTTLYTIVEAQVKSAFGLKTKSILSETLDVILNRYTSICSHSESMDLPCINITREDRNYLLFA